MLDITAQACLYATCRLLPLGAKKNPRLLQARIGGWGAEVSQRSRRPATSLTETNEPEALGAGLEQLAGWNQWGERLKQ